jgi:predicted Rossmann-fold nucleotide-binding protein
MPIPEKLIKEIESVKDLLKHGDTLLNLTLQNLDLRKTDIDWSKIKLANTTFLGCEMSDETELILRKKRAIIYPKLVGLPYNPYRKNLYSWNELMDGYDPDIKKDKSIDLKIYNHFKSFKFSIDINEALAQRIHDHAMDDALEEIVGSDETGMTKKKCVGVMGGHSVPRTDPSFEKVAIMSKMFTEEGYYILSGGGPGIMEAANLGAYFAGKTEEDLKKAIDILKEAPLMSDKNHVIQSKKVIEMYPSGAASVAIPTWAYGHEPSNIFAPLIAKYFSNAIREDILLAVALYGIIYAPGSAGTVQEIFADAAQNHYMTYGYTSPMVFFGKKFWSEDTTIYQSLKQLAKGKAYAEMISISDEPNEIVEFIKKHPPMKK